MNNPIIKRLSPMIPLATRTINPIFGRNKFSKREDIVIHTGQKWDADDYRNVRFMNSPKNVNNNWAVSLIANVPPTKTKERVVWCDGGSGPEGHPRVYINLDKPGIHSCGYCGLRWTKEDGHH